jgi:NADP-dependent 3-hydroxy acid dehydrogenase YdfG
LKGATIVSTFAHKVVVVTGAGSGIGRALAVALAGRGAQLALSDVNTAALEETTRLVRDRGAHVHQTQLDVTRRDAVFAYADTVVARYGTVNQLYNNVGVEHHGAFERAEFTDMQRVIDVNFWGVVNGTKAFLPHLIDSRDGHLINVSSLFGLLAIPGQSAYTASKFAVRGFTEALRQEMLVANHPVRVTCVHPSGVKTAIARHATVGAGEDHAALADYYDRTLVRRTSEGAAQIILNGVRRNKPRVIIGAEAKLLDALVRLVGPAYQRAAAAVVSRALSR